jgi:hypothetical protein
MSEAVYNHKKPLSVGRGVGVRPKYFRKCIKHINMNSRKTILLLIVLAVLGTSGAKAQTAADTARSTALLFYKTYDSIPYITFDVRYTYLSDTLYSDFKYETIKGSYTMSGNKAKYSLGNIDYLQNDSFLIAVYHKDEMMVVSNPPVQNAGSYLPMRALLDSLLDAYSADYDITVDNKIDTLPSSAEPELDTKGYILFTRKPGNTQAQFNRYLLEYDIENNVITKVEYEFVEPGASLTTDDEPDAGQRLLKNSDRKKILRIEFSNYRFDNFSDSVYSENNLIWEEDGEYKPIAQYKYYKIYNARN